MNTDNEIDYPLTEEQQAAFDQIIGPGNFLITGRPGTGKSVLTRALIKHFMAVRKDFEVGAPTGLAALNINGRTLHSIFRLPISRGCIQPDYNNFVQDEKVMAMIKYHINTLIIDEVSMVRCDNLDFIDRLMRRCKGDSRPFGGAKIIMVGDFFQLPPVTDHFEMREIHEHYNSPFAFDAHVFKGNFKIINLSKVLRQKGDPAFINLLDSARYGRITAEQLAVLNTRVASVDDIRIRLTGVNYQADAINKAFLAKLDTQEVEFKAQFTGVWRHKPVEELLRLKVGAQVMVKKNAADRKVGSKERSKVVNGTIGVITDIIKGAVTIDIDGTEDSATIYSAAWEQKIKVRSDTGWGEKFVASYYQMPLPLAWGISIHKSQGQSFDKVHIDASKVFEAGQLYVALSRARTMAGITLESPLRAEMFMANDDVVRFEKNNL